MAFGFSKTRVSPIAIDLGADSVKLLQLVPGDTPQLVAAARATLPEAARKDPEQRQLFLGEALRGLLKRGRFKGRRVMLSIPAFQTLIHHLEVQVAEEADFTAVINMQLLERLNIDAGRMVVRHHPVAEVVRNGSMHREVICLAASRNVVMRYLELAKRLKLQVVGMHSEPAAILRAFAGQGPAPAATAGEVPGPPAAATCYIDMGALTTKVVIAHGGALVFAKAIHAGGDELTRRYAAQHKLSFDDARQRRYEQAAQAGPAVEPAEAGAPASIGPSGGGFSRIPGPGAPGTVAAAPAKIGPRTATTEPAPRLTPASTPAAPAATPGDETVDCLIDELRLCLRHYQGIFPKSPVQKLVFLGGESRQRAVCQQVARAVRIAAQLGDPLARLSSLGKREHAVGVDVDQPQPGWAVALGLCLSEANL